jgi:hypothetical protein
MTNCYKNSVLAVCGMTCVTLNGGVNEVEKFEFGVDSAFFSTFLDAAAAYI